MRKATPILMTIVMACGLIVSQAPAAEFRSSGPTTIQELPGFHVDSFFDVFTEVSFGPPYPAVDSIGLNIGHESGPAGPIITDAVLTAGLEGVSPLDLPVEIFAHGEGSSSQYDPDWWVESFFDVFCEPPDPEPIPPDSFFDVFFDLDLPSGAGSPLLSQVPDVFHIDSFFDITFQIELPDGGLHDLILHGQTAPGVSFV